MTTCSGFVAIILKNSNPGLLFEQILSYFNNLNWSEVSGGLGRKSKILTGKNRKEKGIKTKGLFLSIDKSTNSSNSLKV